jgi:signal transduction histidine kinase
MSWLFRITTACAREEHTMAKIEGNSSFAEASVPGGGSTSGDDESRAPSGLQLLWRYGRVWGVPAVLWVLVVIALREPLTTWLHGQNAYDQAALEEWLKEARGFRQTLPEMIEDYLQRANRLASLQAQKGPVSEVELWNANSKKIVKREEIHEHLQTLGNPPTKLYNGLLPLFPTIYCLQVRLDDEPDDPITWDSRLPSQAGHYPELEYRIHPRATVYLRYQLHAFNERQRLEQEHNQRFWRVGGLALAATPLSLAWGFLVQRRERERERLRHEVQRQADEAERLLLQEERRHAETERQLLEQRLATQAAERQALELKSQLYASIGIMAGSYAHNIKNLLVRPNDLLRRCLETEELAPEQHMMLHEVRQTLGTVTERLQQILRTVRRDPTRSEPTVLDLNSVVHELEHTWKDLARDKWKLELVVEPAAEELLIAGDVSHLQQAVENLLFNARDATFEMRNQLRDAARQGSKLTAEARRQALIAAAAWRGRVILRTRREGEQMVLEVSDNGLGMTEEVRRRCTETHFSTKRDNAIYEGHSTGMGLGLSFVVTILEHHRATLEIQSAPLQGTVFLMRFPAAKNA